MSSKDQYEVHNGKKSYLSHVSWYNDVHDMWEDVKNIFPDATETQYFVYAQNRSIKMRIQKNAVEIMSRKLVGYSEKIDCNRKDDRATYGYMVKCYSQGTVHTILDYLKTI